MNVCSMVALCTALSAVSAWSQTHPTPSDLPATAQTRAEVFGGFALAGGGAVGSDYGFNGGVGFRVCPRTSIAFDVSQFRDSSRSSSNSTSDTVFLAGPQYQIPVHASLRTSLFGEFLVGGDTFHNGGQAYTFTYNSATSFALLAGGGIDYAWSGHLSSRFEGGYLHSRLDYSTYGGPANPSSTANNRARFAVDLMYRF